MKIFDILLFFLIISFGFCYDRVVPIEIQSSEDFIERDVLLEIPTWLPIHQGNMYENCIDMKFVYNEDDSYGIPYFLELGCGTNNTKIWLTLEKIRAGRTLIYMKYDGGEASSNDDSRNKAKLSITNQEAVEDDDGHFIVLVDDDNGCPEGWSMLTEYHQKFLVYCSYNQLSIDEERSANQFIRESSGSISDHKHSCSGTVTSNEGIDLYTAGVGPRHSNNDHWHTVSFTTEAVSEDIYPPFSDYFVCSFDHSAQGFSNVPRSSLVMKTNTNSQSGFSSFSELNQETAFFPRGFAAAETLRLKDKGSLEHNHYVSATNTNGAGQNRDFRVYDPWLLSDDPYPDNEHYHSFSGYFDSISHVPLWKGIPFFESDDDNNYPFEGMIVFTESEVKSSIPGYDLIQDTSSDVHLFPEKAFIGGSHAAFVNNGQMDGGSADHSHTFSIQTGTYIKSQNAVLGDPYQDCATDDHIHTLTQNNVDCPATNNIFPYKYIQMVKRKEEYSDKVYVVGVQWENVTFPNRFCFAVHYSEDEVCGGVGVCVDQDVCVCNKTGGYYGNECTEYFPPGSKAAYVSANRIHIPWRIKLADFVEYDLKDDFGDNFNCSLLIEENVNSYCAWEGENLLYTKYLVVLDAPASPALDVLTVHPITKSTETKYIFVEPYVAPSIVDNSPSILLFWPVVVLPILFLCLCCCCCFCVLALMIIVPTSGLAYIQKKRLTKFKDLENIDLILKEQEIEKDQSIAHLNINSKLFEIDFQSIEIDKKIGEGGSKSTVFKASMFGRVVAFKCFKSVDICKSQKSFDEFEREVSILGSVSHPNILAFYGATLKPPRIGILMEFCSNGDLTKFLKKYSKHHNGEKYSIEDRIRIIGEIANGMAYLSSRGIIHRDLKGENILLNDYCEAKIMDFGLSKMLDTINEDKTKRVGTSYYMSPEMVKGEDYDYKVDVFSFGIMIYEILTDRSAYDGQLQIEWKVANDPKFRPNCVGIELFEDDEKGGEKKKKKKKGGLKWMKLMMEKCWNHQPAFRPSFEEIYHTLTENGKAMKPNIPERSYKRMNAKKNDRKEMENIKKINLDLKEKQKHLKKTIHLLEQQNNELEASLKHIENEEEESIEEEPLEEEDPIGEEEEIIEEEPLEEEPLEEEPLEEEEVKERRESIPAPKIPPRREHHHKDETKGGRAPPPPIPFRKAPLLPQRKVQSWISKETPNFVFANKKAPPVPTKGGNTKRGGSMRLLKEAPPTPTSKGARSKAHPPPIPPKRVF